MNRFCLPSALGALLACGLAGAQSSIDPVVVTATRIATNASMAPAAVTVVDRNSIDARSVSRLGDALNQVPGLYLETSVFGNSSMQSGAAGFSLRGMDNRRTLVLIDGLSVQDAFAASTDFHSFLPDDIQRVEVVPGAFSSLYGSNAIGGVINVISKKPDRHELTLRLREGFGDAKGTDVGFYFRDQVGSNVGLVLGFANSERDGIASFPVDDGNRPPFRQRNAVARVHIELSEDAQLIVGSSYSYFTLTGSNFASSAPAAEGTRRVFVSYDARLFGVVPLKADVARTSRTRFFGRADSPNHTDGAQLQATMPIGRSAELVLGAALHIDDVGSTTYALSNWREPATRTAANSAFTGRSSTGSVFGQLSWRALRHLTLYGSARWDRFSTEGSYLQNTAPSTALNFPRRSEQAFSPKLSLVFDLSDRLALKSSLGKSFRAPSNNDLYSTSVIASANSPTGFLTTRSDPNLEPELAKSGELGLDWRPNALLAFTATAYETRLSDLITAKQIDRSLMLRINSAKARARGIELAAVLRPWSWLDINANYSVTSSKVLESEPDPASVGKRLPAVPLHLAGLSFIARGETLSGSLDIKQHGKRFVTAANTDVVSGVPGSYDGYLLANLKLGWRFSPMLQASLAVNNVFDKRAFAPTLIPGRYATAELVASF